jgi:hypothetical protein
MTIGPEGTGSTPGIHVNEVHLIKFATTVSRRSPAERLANRDLQRLLALQGVSMEDRSSPYRDSRKGSQMKAASLETFKGGETQQLLDSLAWIRDKFFAYTGEPHEQITNHQLWRLCILGEALPTYLMLRAQNPVDRNALPEVVGNVFKTTIGFRNVARPHLEHRKDRSYDSPHRPYVIANT